MILTKSDTLSLKLESVLQKVEWDIGEDTTRGMFSVAVGIAFDGFKK